MEELVAEATLIALFQEDKKIDVRPKIIGCYQLRLFTRAYCSRTKSRIMAHVQDTQLGVFKASYKIGVHEMRLCQEAAQLREGILLLNFANVFNTVHQNLIILIVAKDCPDRQANLVVVQTATMVDHHPRRRRSLFVRNTIRLPLFQPPTCINNAIHRR